MGYFGNCSQVTSVDPTSFRVISPFFSIVLRIVLKEMETFQLCVSLVVSYPPFKR